MGKIGKNTRKYFKKYENHKQMKTFLGIMGGNFGMSNLNDFLDFCPLAPPHPPGLFCPATLWVTDGFIKCLQNPTKNHKSERISVIQNKTEVVELIELIISPPGAPRDQLLNDVS